MPHCPFPSHDRNGTSIFCRLIRTRTRTRTRTLHRTHPFYPARLLQPQPGKGPLPFPNNVLVSGNFFRPSLKEWTGTRRLRNVTIVLEWRPAPPSASSSASLSPFTCYEKANDGLTNADEGLQRDNDNNQDTDQRSIALKSHFVVVTLQDRGTMPLRLLINTIQP